MESRPDLFLGPTPVHLWERAMTIDWRKIFVAYARTVYEDDDVVGHRCLVEPLWCPSWTDDERKAIAEALPDLVEE